MPVDYSNAKIYCIRNRASNDSIVYVGSTTRPISERMAAHRKTIKEKPNIKIYKCMAEVGVEHFHAELLCNFPCSNKEELLAEEGRHIRLHNTIDNGLNTNVAGRSQKEHYVENKVRLCEEKRQNYESNAEILRQKDREWYAANKEKAAVQNKEYRLRNAEHLKEYEAGRAAAKVAKNKAYHEAHREEINARHEEARRLKKAALAGVPVS